MTKIQILIIEDEPHESQKIKELLEEENNFNVVAIATNLKEALGVYFSENIDIILIDIFLNNKPDGIVFAETIMKNKKTLRPFIFLTNANSRTIFESAKLTKPYSYLLKPFNKLELKYTLELALEKFTETPNIFTKDKYPSIYLNENFFIKKNNTLIKVSIKDIQCVTVEGRYSNIKTHNGTYIVQMSLNQLLEKLPTSQFIRVHRNSIINLYKIQKVFLLDNLILLEDKVKVTISRQHKQNFINHYTIFN